jgi:hypothetical protein
MDVTPATKEQLAIEARKLAGASVRESLMRWHRSVNQMSGTFVLLVGKPDKISLAHYDEWLARLATMTKDMERLRKKVAPKRKVKGR